MAPEHMHSPGCPEGRVDRPRHDHVLKHASPHLGVDGVFASQGMRSDLVCGGTVRRAWCMWSCGHCVASLLLCESCLCRRSRSV